MSSVPIILAFIEGRPEPCKAHCVDAVIWGIEQREAAYLFMRCDRGEEVSVRMPLANTSACDLITLRQILILDFVC